MKAKIFKAKIAGQIISMYRRKNMIDRIAFDSIMNEHKGNGRSPGKELIQRLKEKTHCLNEFCILEYLKDKSIEDFGDWPRNLQETIWSILRDA